MKVAIQTGGLGPSPLREIGGQPAVWHLLKHYDRYDFDRFVLGLGDEGPALKRHFVEACSLANDLTVNLGTGSVMPHGRSMPPWQIELIDTGRSTGSGGRLRRLAPYVGSETFLWTRADALANVDLDRLLEFHRSHGKRVTLTAVRPAPLSGLLELERGGEVAKFAARSQPGASWQNGAFYVCEPDVFDYVEGDATVFEEASLEALAADGQLMAYRHEGFWQSLDAPGAVERLDTLWANDRAPWKLWRD